MSMTREDFAGLAASGLSRNTFGGHPPSVVFLSLFRASVLPAHSSFYLRFHPFDRPGGLRYRSPRSEQPERPSQGTEVGTPGKAVRPTGRTLGDGWEAQLAGS